MKRDIIAEIAEEISWLDTDGLWELAKYLNENYRVPATILRADLDLADSLEKS